MTYKILIADDSEAVQKAISMALNTFDVSISKTSSFVETLHHCKKIEPDLIIADARLTGTDGIADFKQLFTGSRRTSILFLEGSFESVEQEEFSRNGFSYIIKKPFDAKKLMDFLNGKMSLVLKPKPKPKPKPNPLRAGPHFVPKKTESESSVNLDLSTDSQVPEFSTKNKIPTKEQSDVLSIDLDSDSDDLVLSLEDEHTPAENHNSYTGNNIPMFTDPPLSSNLDQFFAKKSEEQEGSKSTKNDPGLEERSAANFSNGEQDAFGQHDELISKLLILVKEEVRKQVDVSVQDYCKMHFKGLVREVIQKELQALER